MIKVLFGKYEVLETIKDHTIYKARSIKTGNIVLLNVEKLDYISSVEETKLYQEFDICQRLNVCIPEVPKAVEFIVDENTICSVYTYFEGENLSTLLEMGEQSQIFWLRLIIYVVEVLGNIHSGGFIHEELNPWSIIYNSNDNRIMIKGFSSSVDVVTKHNLLMNDNSIKKYFISPEQTGRVNRVVDKRSDFYSIGMTMYYLFSGEFPFQSIDYKSAIYNHIAVKPQSLNQISKTSINISNIVDKLILKNPDDRYQTVEGLLFDLRKALEGMEKANVLDEFVLGQHDYSTLDFPQSLFGREHELDILKSVFSNSTNIRQILFVQGDAGSGKTSLVNELQQTVVKKQGYFIQGKYCQYRNNIPYLGIGELLNNYINLLKVNDHIKLEAIIHTARLELGNKLDVLLSLIPKLHPIFKNESELGGVKDDDETSFFPLFIKLFNIFVKDSPPLIIFLDDMQWCDQGSLELLEKLFLTEYKNITFICSYRTLNNNTDNGLITLLSNFNEGQNITYLKIEPIGIDSLTELVKSVFRVHTDNVIQLSEFIHDKSRGNPLLIRQILKSLFNKKLFLFDSKRFLWTWDISKIETCDISGDISELLLNELTRLSASKLMALKYASCIGDTLFVKDLLIFENYLPNINDDIKELIRLGYLLPLDSNFRLLSSSIDRLKTVCKSSPIQLKFQHDSIRQVVYKQLSTEEKQLIHLSLGLNALERYNLNNHENKNEIAIHFISCFNMIPDAKLEEVYNIFIEVINLSLKSFSYRLALTFSKTLFEALKDDSWADNYQKSLDVHMLLMNSYYVNRDIKAADNIAKILHSECKSYRTRALIYKKEMQALLFLGDFKGSISKGYKALSLLGYSIKPTISTSYFLLNLMKVIIPLKKKNMSDLYHMSSGHDDDIKLVISILGEFIVPSFMSGESNLFAVATLKQIQLTLKYGNFKESAVAFSNYAILLSGMEKYQEAYEYADLAVSLVDNNNSLAWKSMIYSNFTLFTLPWNKSWSELTQYSKKTMRVAFDSGDQFLLAHHCSYVNQWNPNILIEQSIKEGKKYLERARETGQDGAVILVKLLQARWKSLCGALDERTSLDSDDFDSSVVYKKLKKDNNLSGLAIYHLQTIIINYHYGNYDLAIEHYFKVKEYIKTLAGSAYMFDYTLYGFLITSSIYHKGNNKRDKKLLKEMKNHLNRMEKWSTITPQNFLHFYYILYAEYLYHKGNIKKAAKFYSKAHNSVNDCDMVRDKAIVLEVISRYYSNINENRLSLFFLYNSFKDYNYWGAFGVANYLKESSSEVAELDNYMLINPFTNSSNKYFSKQIDTNDLLDLMSVIQVSQAISGELEIDKLFKKIIDTVLKNMGAERAFFIYKVDNKWTMFSESVSMPLIDNGVIAYDIFKESLLTKSIICYDNALKSEIGSNNLYLIGKGVKSLLCYPLISKDKIIGFWYMENNLISGVFNKERIEVLSILSSQIKISLENASIYKELDSLNKNLEKIVSSRTKELQQANVKLQKLSITDSLTGLYNRYKVDDLIVYETNMHSRFKNPLSMLIIDIDNFKSINDNFGHLLGDEVLIKLASILKAIIRVTDSVARWGGEEFIILLPGTDLKSSQKIAEEIRDRVSLERDFPTGIITVSIGAAEFSSEISVRQWIHNADLALYKAKENGRNRVELFL